MFRGCTEAKAAFIRVPYGIDVTLALPGRAESVTSLADFVV